MMERERINQAMDMHSETDDINREQYKAMKKYQFRQTTIKLIVYTIVLIAIVAALFIWAKTAM